MKNFETKLHAYIQPYIEKKDYTHARNYINQHKNTFINRGDWESVYICTVTDAHVLLDKATGTRDQGLYNDAIQMLKSARFYVNKLDGKRREQLDYELGNMIMSFIGIALVSTAKSAA